MSVRVTNSSQTVKAGDRLQVTLQRAFWQGAGVFTEFWNRVPGALYAYTISAPPSGADKSAIVDVAVNQSGNGKTLGQIGADLYSVASGLWGPDILDVTTLKASDMRSAVAPARRMSAEAEATKKAEQANPLNKLVNALGFSGKLIALLAIAVIVFYAVPLIRAKGRK